MQSAVSSSPTVDGVFLDAATCWGWTSCLDGRGVIALGGGGVDAEIDRPYEGERSGREETVVWIGGDHRQEGRKKSIHGICQAV